MTVSTERRCAEEDCGTVLSMRNHGETCWPCEDRLNARSTLTQPPPKRQTKSELWHEQRLTDALIAARTLTPIFSSAQLGRVMGLGSNAAASWLSHLAARGDVRSLGRAPGPGPRVNNNRRPVTMWTTT